MGCNDRIVELEIELQEAHALLQEARPELARGGNVQLVAQIDAFIYDAPSDALPGTGPSA